jgi:2-Cys peroxiredoxin 5
MVKAGDSVPNIDLVEGSPGNKVNLFEELGSGLIIGVPAAFSTCLSVVHVLRSAAQSD